MKTLILFFVLVVAACAPVSGQIQPPADSTKIYQVDTKDGNSYVGKIRGVTPEHLVLETTTVGTLNLRQVDIKSVTEVKPETIKNGENWFENPQAARYFWAPNGYGLKKGEAYYQNVWVLANQFSVGITNNITIGLGLVPTFLFGVGATPFWVTPKVSIPVVKDKFNVGAGVLYANVVGKDAETGKGIALAYGITTFGSRDKNVSIGVGYGWANGGWSSRPTINVSFMARVTRNGYFLSENYFIPTQEGNYGIISMGGRKILKKVGLDFGGFIPMGTGVEKFIVIPWLGVSVPLGKKPTE
jgi:hypothetical protein